MEMEYRDIMLTLVSSRTHLEPALKDTAGKRRSPARQLTTGYQQLSKVLCTVVHTVEAPNFPPHGNLPHFLVRSVAPLGDSVVKINKINSADLIGLSNFYSL
jgi:hypothetical protein